MESPLQISTNSFSTDFCLQLAYKAMLKEAESGSNFASSPMSLHLILSLIAAGSTGKTLKQLLSFLGSNKADELNLLSAQIISCIRDAERSESGGPILSFINGAWVEQSFGLKTSFEQIVKEVYRSQIEVVDFINEADQVTKQVNSWAGNASNGLIKELFPSGFLDENTRLVMANALYFKGAWDQKFDTSRTQTKSFNLLNGQIVQVPFMTSKSYEKHYYKSFDNYKILQIPYQTGTNSLKFAMYFFLPHENDGLTGLIRTLNSSPEILNQDFRLQKEKINHFWIPKFKFSFNFEVIDHMKELGLTLPLIPGELAEISDSPFGHKLFVSTILQKAFIEVNEEGTEAIASTALAVRFRCARYPISRFVADHPFMFMIREETCRVVFFLGAVLNPCLVS